MLNSQYLVANSWSPYLKFQYLAGEIAEKSLILAALLLFRSVKTKSNKAIKEKFTNKTANVIKKSTSPNLSQTFAFTYFGEAAINNFTTTV